MDNRKEDFSTNIPLMKMVANLLFCTFLLEFENG